MKNSQVALSALLVLPCFALLQHEQQPLVNHHRFFDVQGHRGTRGLTVENTLPAFAWALIHGATTLELDNGITKDGVVVVWHDQQIKASKCLDTSPAYPGDPDYPYVGKYIANLTYAQLRTLDCGSLRQKVFPFQLLYPKTRISSLKEVFDFVDCADPTHQVLFNIESKIDPEHPTRSVGVDEFVTRQHTVFSASAYNHLITYQSFDWRTLILMKTRGPQIAISALIDESTIYGKDNATSAWLAGRRPDRFPGASLSAQIAMAADSIGASILSPQDVFLNGSLFVTREMVDKAHSLEMQVKPWTVNDLNIASELLNLGVDGIISDYPDVLRRWAKQNNLLVAPKYPKQRVFSCLDHYLAL